MLECVTFFAVHTTAHLLLYSIPRLFHTIFVRAPVTLWELITFKRPFTYDRAAEKHITVVATSKEAAAKERLMRWFGLRDDMAYHGGPMYNGHIHTVIGNLRLPEHVSYERELVTAPDGNPICLDWLKAASKERADHNGIILIIPGVGNYGQTPYIQRFVREAAGRGYHCCLLTPRGMGSAPLMTPNITCITFSRDVNFILRHRLNKKAIAAEFGSALPLFMVGYSCGASTMLKSLGEETEANDKSGGTLYPGGFPVAAAVSMLAPCDMRASSEALRTRLGRRIYAKPILIALRKYLVKHREVLLSASKGKSDVEKVQMAVIHVDFDETLCRVKEPRDVDRHVLAPHFNYKDEFDYYDNCFAFNFIQHIQSVPVLCVSNRDDPISGYALTPADWQTVCDERPNIVYMELPCGGHFGYVQNPVMEILHRSSDLQNIPLRALDNFVMATGTGKKND